MKSERENMKSVMAFQNFRDGRRVEEGQYPSRLMPWIFADVIYKGTDVKTKPISHAKIRYEDDGRGFHLTIEDLADDFTYFADFRTYYQDFVYDEVRDTLLITGEAYNDPNKKYEITLS